MAKITSYAHLSEGELYRKLSSSRWATYSKETRLELFQEVENREAAKQGRPALEIKVFTPDEEKNYMGAYCHACPGELQLNERFITCEEGYLEDYSVAEGLDTIIHEGRHAFQHLAVDGVVPGVDEEQLKMWKLNCVAYMAPGTVLYEQQEIERDARNYARNEMQRIVETIREEKGIEDLAYEAFLFKQHQYEYICTMVADMQLDEETLDAIDAMAQVYYAELYPDEDMSDVTLFAEYRAQRAKRELDALEEILDMIDSATDNVKIKEKPDKPTFRESFRKMGL